MTRQELEKAVLNIALTDMEYIGETETILDEIAAATDEELIEYIRESED